MSVPSTVQRTAAALILFTLAITAAVSAQGYPEKEDTSKAVHATRPQLELFGRLATNIIHDFKRTNPDWFDVLRVSKLPSFEGEFGRNHHSYFSVRTTRLGIKPTIPTRLGNIYGKFEFDMFGTGPNVGRTAFHLQFAYIELGKFGLGQYYSPFMEIDVFPHSLEYWGPSGIVFFQNIQLRYMPIQGASRVTFAIERPGASGDRGDNDDDRVDLSNVLGRFPYPDVSAEARWGGKHGFIELSGILRAIYWDDLAISDQFDLNGSTLGWGLSLSSVANNAKRDQLKLQITYGKAIQNFLDAPFDIGVEVHPGSLFRPFTGVPLPVFAMLLFYDRYWSDRFSSTIGYSRVDVDNSDGQSRFAFHSGEYALVNLLFNPLPEILVGGELQWGRRKNAFDDFSFSDFRFQFTGRFNYAFTLGNRNAAADDKQ